TGDAPCRRGVRRVVRLLDEAHALRRGAQISNLAGGDRVRVPVTLVPERDVLRVGRELAVPLDVLLHDFARAGRGVDEIDVRGAIAPHRLDHVPLARIRDAD